MKLRRFNEAWIKAFREQLADLRANPKHEIPSDPLEHRDFTEVVTPESHVAPEHFQTKCEAARYLIAVLNKLRPEPCIFEALDRLYWDESLRTHRRGITAIKEHAGDLTHRLPMRIRQLEKNVRLDEPQRRPTPGTP